MSVYVLCDFHVSQKISHPACPCDHYFEKVDPPKSPGLLLLEQEFQQKNLV